MACCRDATFSDCVSELSRACATRPAVALKVVWSACCTFEMDTTLSLVSLEGVACFVGGATGEVIELIVCCGLPMPFIKLMVCLRLLECIGFESTNFSTRGFSFRKFSGVPI